MMNIRNYDKMMAIVNSLISIATIRALAGGGLYSGRTQTPKPTETPN